MRSIDKRAELETLVDLHNPFVILGQESKLGPDFFSSQIFPKGYKPFRKEHKDGGGGVFILVRDDVDHVEDAHTDIDQGCECIWVQLKLHNGKLLNVASFYRPTDSKIDIMDKFHSSISNVLSKYKESQISIGGDFNLPGID